MSQLDSPIPNEWYEYKLEKPVARNTWRNPLEELSYQIVRMEQYGDAPPSLEWFKKLFRSVVEHETRDF